jgi:uncharacterized protein with HEPN domain
MPLDAKTYLFDIVNAIAAIEQFVGVRDFDAYSSDALLVSAVERQLMIVGEAVTQLRKVDPAATISSAAQIIGFRNILVHNYARVSQALIWTILQDHLPTLKRECQTMLEA